MAHVARNADGTMSVPNAISIMTQSVPVPAPAYTAAGYVVPPVTYVPPDTVATIVTSHRSRGSRAGFGAAPPTAGGTYAQCTAASTTTNATTHVRNYYKVFSNWNMCFSCESDVPNCHTSAMCPATTST